MEHKPEVGGRSRDCTVWNDMDLPHSVYTSLQWR